MKIILNNVNYTVFQKISMLFLTVSEAEFHKFSYLLSYQPLIFQNVNVLSVSKWTLLKTAFIMLPYGE